MTKRVTLPKKIKIGGHEYDVIFPYNFKEIDSYLGLHDLLARKIYISEVDYSGNIRKDSDIYKTLLHEILHGIDSVYLKDRLAEEDDHEKIIDSLADGLLQVLTDANLLKKLPQRRKKRAKK